MIPKVEGATTLKLAPMTIKFKSIEEVSKVEEEKKENQNPNEDEADRPKSKTKVGPAQNSTKIF